MPTLKQISGDKGEMLVAKLCSCPNCKKDNTFKKLKGNFKCADIICDFCGYMVQVKTKETNDINKLPNQILGGAWKVQKERMDAGRYISLFVVLKEKENEKNIAIYYLSSDLQEPNIFIPRKPLSATAKRANWQGFYYKFDKGTKDAFKRIY